MGKGTALKCKGTFLVLVQFFVARYFRREGTLASSQSAHYSSQVVLGNGGGLMSKTNFTKREKCTVIQNGCSIKNISGAPYPCLKLSSEHPLPCKFCCRSKCQRGMNVK